MEVSAYTYSVSNFRIYNIERPRDHHKISRNTIDQIFGLLMNLEGSVASLYAANLEISLDADQMQDKLHQRTVESYKGQLMDQERIFEL